MKTRIPVFVLLFLMGSLAFGQMTIRGVSRLDNTKIQKSSRTENTPILLPFWDDFSTSQNLPDPDLWTDSEDVWINPGMGIQPPSINVATFDGLDVNGKPYSLDPLTDGLTDVLTSHNIDLSSYLPTDNVYLSFFYQGKGNGELPNENDSLRVEFKDVNGDWKKGWSVKGIDIVPEDFNLVSLQLGNSDFLHADFQFRFLAYGRQSGPFDSWNLDYVYLNDNVTNFDFPDRAIQTKPTSLFKRYQAIPIHHFNQDPSTLRELPTATAFNLFNLLQPSNFTMIANVESLQPDLTMSTDSDTLAFEIISSFPDPGSGPRQIDLVANKLLDPGKVASDTFARINIRLFMNTDDNQPPDYQPEFAPLDFRINDTTSVVQELHDYYAYDDGTAEFAAGLNFAGDMVAYEFPMFFTGTDTLVSVDMYFPNLGGNVGGQIIELIVWDELDNNPASVLHSQFISLKAPEAINKFTNYLLETPVIVQDTFYLGWRQTSAGNLDIGLDKNTDSGSRIYFNLDGTWQQNTKVEGSLMLRPRFGKVDLVLSNTEYTDTEISIYPNPNPGTFTIEGNISQLEVFNITGSRVPFENTISAGRNNVRLNDPVPGIYLLRFLEGEAVRSRRIVVR